MSPADAGSPGLPICAHCGEAAPAPRWHGEGAARRAYCCEGCAAAARFIEEAGLGDYYRWRSAPGPRPEGATDFRDWDREEVLAEHSEAVDEGRCLRLAVGGMHCAACAWLVDKALRAAPGVREVSANAVEGRVRLVWDPAQTALSPLLERIARLGYTPSLVASPAQEQTRRRARRRRLGALGVAGLGTLQAMMFSEALYLDVDGSMPLATRDAFRWLTAAVSAPVVFWAGAPFLRGMANELRHRLPGMDTLIGSGVLLAWGASVLETLRGGPQVWFDAAVMFVFFLLAARHLEAGLRERGQARLDAIAGAQPAFAWRERADGTLEQVPARRLAVGDVVRVGAGAALPCDGVLLEDEAWLDEAVLSGESTPRHRRRGETLPAGALVHRGSLRLRATAVGEASSLSRFARRVEALRGQRPAQVDWAEAWARRVVGVTVLLALAVMAVWSVIDPPRAFPIGLAVLVATCPCALALAVPAAIARAQARLAEHGLLVLGPEALPRLAGITTVVFDKTGTLTRGEPRLLSLTPLAGWPAEACRALAARIEAAVEHPLARAFGEAAGPPPERVRPVPGQGVEALLDGACWRLGRRSFALAGGEAGEDGGALWLAREGQAVARFEIDDAPREDAAEAVAALRAAGLELALLSGDAEARVAALAARLGLGQAPRWARQGPEDKLAVLRRLQADGRRVLMVGDGSNDAGVLAAADVSVAMGEGTALAQRQADLVLCGERLSRLPWAIALARQTQSVIRQNLRWAVAYNALVLPLAALGFIGPGLAALGMALSSLAVTANAWRIGRTPP